VTTAAHDTVERALVAAVLAQPSLIDELEAVVSERDFSQRAARLVYRAARALRDRGDTPDVLTIAAFLESRRQLAAAEGFLRDLVATPQDVRLPPPPAGAPGGRAPPRRPPHPPPPPPPPARGGGGGRAGGRRGPPGGGPPPTPAIGQ